MKHLLINTVFLIIAAWNPQLTFAEDPETKDMFEDDNKKDDHNRGQRIPPAPVICIIDYDAGEIVSESPLVREASDFQLWDLDNTICLFSSHESKIVVGFLQDHRGESMLLKITGDDYTLTGYINY